jgi:saccharopine dehydrogenase (NADP+, L-glutamate forming)
MKRVLIIGAGRSATVCIEYLANKAAQQQISLTLADGSGELVKQKAANFPHIQQAEIHLENKEAVNALIKGNDIVISLLPAHLHIEIATICLANNTHLLTASYVSAAMQALHSEVEAKGLIFLNECGLDPGIDHLSAMEIIDNIHAEGYTINSFKSFAGGLVAPESDNNPWGYKFSWNPRNVVIAGQSTATFLEEGRMKFVPYQQLFQREEVVTVHGYGQFDAYPNRDSLGYQKIYGLQKVHTMVRGTLRKHGYCEAWHALVMLGLTDDTLQLHLPEGTTFQDWVQMYLPHSETARLGIEVLLPGISLHAIDKLDWLGMFSKEPLPIINGTAAQILQALLEDKWRLAHGDRDMIVMQHQFVYSKGGKSKQLISELVVEGDNETHTAMAKTVGLPLAMACMLIVENKITTKGVQIPVTKNWYQPLLVALKEEGIIFNHQAQ